MLLNRRVYHGPGSLQGFFTVIEHQIQLISDNHTMFETKNICRKIFIRRM